MALPAFERRTEPWGCLCLANRLPREPGAVKSHIKTDVILSTITISPFSPVSTIVSPGIPVFYMRIFARPANVSAARLDVFPPLQFVHLL